MYARGLLVLFASILGQALVAAAGQNVAVYWGQNAGRSQDRLSTYCEDDSVDIVLLAFANEFPNLEINFANQCGESFSSGLLHCPQIGQDIKTCQSKGKKVLLSLGGASGGYGFHGSSADSDAEKFATTLWNKFGGGSDNERPFDDAVVDGFDFDLENLNQAGIVSLGKALRTKFSQDSSKSFYLSAAPQCVYPDASVGDLLANVDIDFAFIQFYNNYCSLGGGSFNWNTWQDFAENKSPNKNIQLYVGLPGSQASAGSGYVSIDEIKQKLSSDILNSKNFGGVMLWDASSADSNKDSSGTSFTKQIKNLLGRSNSGQQSSASTSSAVTQPQTSSEQATTSVAATTQQTTAQTEASLPTQEPSSTTTAIADANKNPVANGEQNKAPVQQPDAGNDAQTAAPQPQPTTSSFTSSTLRTVRVTDTPKPTETSANGGSNGNGNANVETEVIVVTRVISTEYTTTTTTASPQATGL